MPMDEAVLDFHSLGVVDTPQGQRTRVVVVAVRREMVERYAEAIRAAGLKLEGIDLSAFAMVRAFSDAVVDAQAVMFVNVAGLTNVAVASEGRAGLDAAEGPAVVEVARGISAATEVANPRSSR